VKRLCILNTIVAGQAPHLAVQIFDASWYKWIYGGGSRDVLGKLGSTVLSVMKSVGFERAAQANETLVHAYATPFPYEAACKGAIQFPFNIASKETIEFLIEGATRTGAQNAIKALPAMYVHGEVNHALPTEYEVACFHNAWHKGPVVTLPGVGHFLQEDVPEVVIALIDQFIQMT
jgi:haloalkane dehalogenase